MLYIRLFFLSFFIQAGFSERCELSENCRLVDINGDDEWILEPGHYRRIQTCIDEAKSGDTCLVRSGRYHEEMMISDKNNLAIRGDTDFEIPVIDGTIDLNPITHAIYSDSGKEVKGSWEEEFIGENKVCVGEIEIIDDKHPFQLFVMENNVLEMMTNARWPNAIWADKDTDTGTPMVFYNDFWGMSDESSTRGKMVDRVVNGTSPLAASGLNVKDAMAILNVGFWNTFVKPVIEHKPGDNFFTYEDDFGDIRFNPAKNQYYLDSSESLLDTPGEWYYNMDTHILKFIPLTGSCPEPNSGAVRGRVIDYGITVTKADGLYISNLEFFAANINATYIRYAMDINEFYLDSVRFNYPSSSKRMLQDYNVPKITQIGAGSKGTISITNCEFIGGEGSALYYYGRNAKVHNNLFKWNDWSGQMGLYKNGGFGTVYAGPHACQEEFIGNTLYYNGASAGYRPGYGLDNRPKTLNNLVVGQGAGNIMNDGSAIQLQPSSVNGSLTEGNWVFDSPKLAIRWDDQDHGSTQGVGGTLSRNVAWNTGGYELKGDFHQITENIALQNYDEDTPGLIVIHEYWSHTEIQNSNSKVESNAACLADGGIDQHSTQHGPWGQWPMAGIKKNNYYGNHSWYGGDGYDGSWVLDGATVDPPVKLSYQLMNANDHDFRPKPGTVLTSTGTQIGPYATAYSSETKYLIAGRKEWKASHPIPHDKWSVPLKDALMFQPAYRCDYGDYKHMIYLSLLNDDFPAVDNPTKVLFGNNNIVAFDQINVPIVPGERYKWRVDCVDETKDERRTGDIWQFTMYEE